MPPTPNRGDSKIGCGRSKQWFGDGWQVSGILQPEKEIGPKPCETAARKLPKRCFWTLLKTKKKPASHQAKLKKKVFGTRMRKGRTAAGFVPKPLRNRSRKNAETSLLEPIRKERNICPNHAKPQPENCRNVAFGTYDENAEKRKMPKRCFWNRLKTKKKVASSKANLCAT